MLMNASFWMVKRKTFYRKWIQDFKNDANPQIKNSIKLSQHVAKKLTRCTFEWDKKIILNSVGHLTLYECNKVSLVTKWKNNQKCRREINNTFDATLWCFSLVLNARENLFKEKKV